MHALGDLMPFHVFGDFLKIGKATIRARTDKGDVDLLAFNWAATLELHVFEGFGYGIPLRLCGRIGDSWNTFLNAYSLPRSDPPCNGGLDLRSVDINLVIKSAICV